MRAHFCLRSLLGASALFVCLVAVASAGRTRTNTGREGQPGTYTEGADVNLLVGMLGIGNVVLIPLNAEAYSVIGQGVKAKSPLANTVFVGLSNGMANSGYVPSDEAFGHYTFQVLGSRLKPGCAETGNSKRRARSVGGIRKLHRQKQVVKGMIGVTRDGWRQFGVRPNLRLQHWS